MFFIIKLIIIILPILLSIAFMTLVERKVLASFQKRVGPNIVGSLGLLQAFADALKLIVKEYIIPKLSNKIIFNISPIISLVLSLLSLIILPFNNFIYFFNIHLSILYIFALSSLHLYGIIMAGWASNSRYAFLGALRSSAQMISYEVSIGLILISILLSINSLNLIEIIYFQKNIYFIVPFFPSFILFFISAIAESFRTPFDLSEAEGELVSGYNVEYSSANFALFFIGEYCNTIFLSVLIIHLFFGGFLNLPYTFLNLFFFNFGFLWYFNSFIYIINNNNLLFLLKIILFLFLFVWIRASFPRYRYDQLMRLGWKIFLPLSLFLIVSTIINIIIFDYLYLNFNFIYIIYLISFSIGLFLIKNNFKYSYFILFNFNISLDYSTNFDLFIPVFVLALVYTIKELVRLVLIFKIKKIKKIKPIFRKRDLNQGEIVTSQLLLLAIICYCLYPNPENPEDKSKITKQDSDSEVENKLYYEKIINFYKHNYDYKYKEAMINNGFPVTDYNTNIDYKAVWETIYSFEVEPFIEMNIEDFEINKANLESMKKEWQNYDEFIKKANHFKNKTGPYSSSVLLFLCTNTNLLINIIFSILVIIYIFIIFKNNFTKKNSIKKNFLPIFSFITISNSNNDLFNYIINFNFNTIIILLIPIFFLLVIVYYSIKNYYCNEYLEKEITDQINSHSTEKYELITKKQFTYSGLCAHTIQYYSEYSIFVNKFKFIFYIFLISTAVVTLIKHFSSINNYNPFNFKFLISIIIIYLIVLFLDYLDISLITNSITILFEIVKLTLYFFGIIYLIKAYICFGLIEYLNLDSLKMIYNNEFIVTITQQISEQQKIAYLLKLDKYNNLLVFNNTIIDQLIYNTKSYSDIYTNYTNYKQQLNLSFLFILNTKIIKNFNLIKNKFIYTAGPIISATSNSNEDPNDNPDNFFNLKSGCNSQQDLTESFIDSDKPSFISLAQRFTRNLSETISDTSYDTFFNLTTYTPPFDIVSVIQGLNFSGIIAITAITGVALSRYNNINPLISLLSFGRVRSRIFLPQTFISNVGMTSIYNILSSINNPNYDPRTDGVSTILFIPLVALTPRIRIFPNSRIYNRYLNDSFKKKNFLIFFPLLLSDFFNFSTESFNLYIILLYKLFLYSTIIYFFIILIIVLFISYLYYTKHKNIINSYNIYFYNIINYLNYFFSLDSIIKIRLVLTNIYSYLLFILVLILCLFNNYNFYTINNNIKYSIPITFIIFFLIIIISINYYKKAEYTNLLLISNKKLQFNNIIFSLPRYFLNTILINLIILLVIILLSMFFFDLEFCTIIIQDLNLSFFIEKSYSINELYNYIDLIDTNDQLTYYEKNNIVKSCKSKKQILELYKITILNR